MNRDDKLTQVATEFGFNPDEEIRIGGKYTPILVDGNTAYVAGQIPRIGDVVHFVGIVGNPFRSTKVAGPPAYRRCVRCR